MPNSNKHHCHKQSCTGIQNDQQNYLQSTLQPHNTSKSYHAHTSRRSTSRHKLDKLIIKKQSHIKNKLEDQVTTQKLINIELTKKLLACKQTINNLKTTVKLQQEKLIIYEKKINKENDHIKENMNNDNNNNKNKNKEKDKEKEKERQDKKKEQIKIDEQINKLYKKCKDIEKQFKVYRQEKEKELAMLKIVMQQTQRQTERQSSTQTHINLQNSQSHSLTKYQTHINHLQSQLQSKQNQLQHLNNQFSLRQSELLSNLQQINQRVQQFQHNYNHTMLQCQQYQHNYEQLLKKYDRQRDKQMKNKEQWEGIIREFVEEIERLKKEIKGVTERNVRLVKMAAME